MPNAHGDWVWYELMTPDADGAARFYQGLLDWTVDDQPHYREIEASAGKIGGILPLSPEMAQHGATAGWVGYVNVADVDRAVESIAHGGGRVLMPAHDMEGVGRFAMVADPAGARFYVMTPVAGRTDDSNAFAADRPLIGHVAWNELATTDVAEAFHFYGTRFGWVKDGEMDMGPNGTYSFIRHQVLTGGVAQTFPGQQPAWTFYFRVPSIPAAVGRVEAGGGRIILDPMEIPGGDHIIIGTDPQGATFALVGGKD